MKTIKIALRTNNGWISGVKNKTDKENPTCNRCGARLWVAPSKKVYCDNTHADKKN